ncbi:MULTISPECIES: hypothetical protein [Marinobacter]|uniref:hypothetical protein n=1 Tax=Marinobacter TaxID=2742 RepID=UPI00124444B4|nr:MULTISPECIES: hypothetical protein [Marinobacter]MBL3557645.1 hypothetical protein [Marinobacter sp. JB05H06]
MSHVQSIQVENFRESLKLTQRSIFLGLLVAGIVHYLGHMDEGRALPGVPFLNVEFSSLESLQVVLLVLYIGSGVTAWFSTSRAFNVLRDIDDPLVAVAASKYPCLVVSNIWVSSLLAGALLGIGYLLLSSIFVFDSLLERSLYFIVSLPYFATLRTGSEIHSWHRKYVAES